MSVQELGGDIRAKRERDSSVVLSPPLDVFVGIRPQQVTQQASVWDIGGPGYGPNLIKVVQVR